MRDGLFRISLLQAKVDDEVRTEYDRSEMTYERFGRGYERLRQETSGAGKYDRSESTYERSGENTSGPGRYDRFEITYERFGKEYERLRQETSGPGKI
ncbi:hypothetical protein [Sporosarcina sp. Te-1]|uniref:hypothetical protein n=1 Tax=Sporosarcina sp. Te-1 TaxID=2818390 RepID=UPI001A9FA797|nr:hypothetical protein [Sporosarcina sp. Te-1]QTD40681.1 hypothetical protein J3U78_18265 [Sporosarcina sp. Te-1]